MFKKFFEGTVSTDIAGSGSGCIEGKPSEDCKCPKCKMRNAKKVEKALAESPVGSVGRTGRADAADHVTAALRAQFKKIVKQLGGKTVARQLLAEMNGQMIEGSACDEARRALKSLLAFSSTSRRLKNAIDDVFDIMDTDC